MRAILPIMLSASVAAQAAQTPPEAGIGSRIPRASSNKVSQQDEVRRVQKLYGECVVSKRSEAASHYVIKPHFDRDELKTIIGKIGDPDCLVFAFGGGGPVMSFYGDSMRYTLADALVRREFATSPIAQIAVAGPIQQDVLREEEYSLGPNKKPSKSKQEELAAKRSRDEATIYVARFGECVVRAEPEKSYALIMSDPVTDAEGAAIKVLAPSLGKCVVVGQNLKFDRATLRGTIAMNYYRLAHAAPAPQPAEGATH